MEVDDVVALVVSHESGSTRCRLSDGVARWLEPPLMRWSVVLVLLLLLVVLLSCGDDEPLRAPCIASLLL